MTKKVFNKFFKNINDVWEFWFSLLKSEMTEVLSVWISSETASQPIRRRRVEFIMIYYIFHFCRLKLQDHWQCKICQPQQTWWRTYLYYLSNKYTDSWRKTDLLTTKSWNISQMSFNISCIHLVHLLWFASFLALTHSGILGTPE